jgi:hypothetical protein
MSSRNPSVSVWPASESQVGLVPIASDLRADHARYCFLLPEYSRLAPLYFSRLAPRMCSGFARARRTSLQNVAQDISRPSSESRCQTCLSVSPNPGQLESAAESNAGERSWSGEAPRQVSPECGGSDLGLTLALVVYTYSMREAVRQMKIRREARTAQTGAT